MKWIFLPLRRYAQFDGRASRIEYWSFTGVVLFVIIGLIVTAVALSWTGGSVATSSDEANPLIGLPLVIALIFFLGMVVPLLAVTVRRLHDRDLSGAFLLINLIPYVGWAISFFLMFLSGTPGENQYGDNPLDDDGRDPDQLEQIFG